MATSVSLARLGEAAPPSPGVSSFVASASFASTVVEGALPYLIDVVHNVGLDADTAADVVLVIYEEMRAAAGHADTRDVGVEVEMEPDTLRVTVHEHTDVTAASRPASAVSSAKRPDGDSPQRSHGDSRFVGRGYQRHSVNTWFILTRTTDKPLVSYAGLDRAALVAGLSRAPASMLAVSAARGGRTSASLELAVDRTAPASVRRHVVRAMQEGAVSADVQADVELLASELVSNVIRHEDALTLTIDMVVDVDRAVTVTVTGGRGEPSPALVHPAGPPELSSESGRGLDMLDSLASAWGTHREQRTTAVWFTVRRIEGAAHAGAPRRPSLAHTTTIGPASGRLSREPAEFMPVIARAEVIAAATEPQHSTAPELDWAGNTAKQAVVDAAARAAHAARDVRAARALEASKAATAVAEVAARTVETVHARADELAIAVTAAASDAAATVLSWLSGGGDAAAARASLEGAAAVISAAAVNAEATARAAVVVARAVAAGAAALSAAKAADATASEDEVLDAAIAMQAVTTATAQRLANDALARADDAAVETRTAVAAADRLRAANVQLRRAGRHDRAVARALQDALLTQLPDSDGLELAARYRTAAEEDQVGGDWYDAFVLSDGSTVLVIGDVVGHDIAAAAVMGHLRNMLRALVWDRHEAPSAIVSRLDRAVRDLNIDTMATLLVARVNGPAPHTRTKPSTVSWTNAGHPAPILVHPDGTAMELDDGTDILLGVLPESGRTDHVHRIPPGATLLLYTDGLIESRTPQSDVGRKALLAAVGKHHRLALGAFLDAVLADMVNNRPRDDVAVLAARFESR